MRLINSTTYELGEFSGKIPEYAILSHTWGDEELSFQSMKELNAQKMAGFAKIEGCCGQAKRDGFDHVWIDTCCIDKTSSAELSEAINSMYQWYKEAQVCYVYLADVPSGQDPQSPNSLFERSRWFTRGWTLQELIGPSSLIFYGKDWCEIGTKLSLQRKVSEITGIPINALKFGNVEYFSIAQRMSWASERLTTRIEDQAYSLMGLFGVNMPMLYGEGKKAFARLQEEIMKTSGDHTLFAWTENGSERRWITRGALADSPAEFVDSGDIIQSKPILKSTPYSMTNRGLHIELPLFLLYNSVWFAILNCKRSSSADEVDTIQKEQAGKFENRAVYIIQKSVEDLGVQELRILHPFQVSLLMTQPELGDGYKRLEVYSSSSDWRIIRDDCYRFVGRSTGVMGILQYQCKNAEDFVVILGHCKGLAWCDLETDMVNKHLMTVYDAYRRGSHEDRVDRITKQLKDGRSVAVAIRKTAKQQTIREGDYDGGYAVYISINVDLRDKGTSKLFGTLKD
jgi:hypothetical protein